MSYTMTVSPGFKPELIPGWYIFNTWLQKNIGENIHFKLVHHFDELKTLIDNDEIDLIYANPHDMSHLIRNKSFKPIAKPVAKADEVIIITKSDSEIDDIESLSPGVTVSVADAPNINMIGTIMLEPADISPHDIHQIQCSNYVTVAKKVIKDEAQIGFILADAYDEFSSLMKKQIKPLIRSQIHLLHHVFLISPELAEKHPSLLTQLMSLNEEQKGIKLMSSLELGGWKPVTTEEVEFLIDILDTLQT